MNTFPWKPRRKSLVKAELFNVYLRGLPEQFMTSTFPISARRETYGEDVVATCDDDVNPSSRPKSKPHLLGQFGGVGGGRG